MKAAILNRIAKIWRDRNGVSAVEFGAVAPFLGLLIVGVADFGRGYSERIALQQAANRTLELAHTGTRMNNYDFLRTHAERAAGTGSVATVTQWLECGTDITKRPLTNTCSASEQTARYVTLEIVKDFDPIFTSVGYPDVKPNGDVPLKARASLRVQ